MIIAGFYYLMCMAVAFSNGSSWLSDLIICFLFPVIIFSFIEFRKNNKKSIISLALSFVLLLIASLIAPVTFPESLAIVGEDIVLEDVSETVNVDFIAKPDNASVSGVKLVCENENIASFKGNVLTAISEGETYIYAHLPDKNVKSESVKVVVKDKKAEILRKAKVIEDKIDSIGEVTLDSKEKIEEAKLMYNSADEEVRNAVGNYSIITDSETKYAQLEKEKAEQEKAEQERLATEKAEQERIAQEKAEQERIAKEKAQQSQSSQNQNNSSTISQNNALSGSKSTGSSSSSSASAGSSSSVTGSSSPSGRTVYIGETGTKYHKSICSTLKGGGIPISYDEAISQGRAACKRCGG